MKPWLMPAIQFVHMYVQRWLALITSDVRLTGLLYFAKRNGAKRNETKWKSAVCEMTICSLGNDNLLSRCVYSDILSRKFPSKKPFRPENSDCAECVTFSLPRIKFNLSSGVFERRTATGSKTSSLFICLDATTFVLISVITLIETICLKICPRTTAQECKKSTSGDRWNALC